MWRILDDHHWDAERGLEVYVCQMNKMMIEEKEEDKRKNTKYNMASTSWIRLTSFSQKRVEEEEEGEREMVRVSKTTAGIKIITSETKFTGSQTSSISFSSSSSLSAFRHYSSSIISSRQIILNYPPSVGSFLFILVTKRSVCLHFLFMLSFFLFPRLSLTHSFSLFCMCSSFEYWRALTITSNTYALKKKDPRALFARCVARVVWETFSVKIWCPY